MIVLKQQLASDCDGLLPLVSTIWTFDTIVNIFFVGVVFHIYIRDQSISISVGRDLCELPEALKFKFSHWEMYRLFETWSCLWSFVGVLT